MAYHPQSHGDKSTGSVTIYEESRFILIADTAPSKSEYLLIGVAIYTRTSERTSERARTSNRPFNNEIYPRKVPGSRWTHVENWKVLISRTQCRFHGKITRFEADLPGPRKLRVPSRSAANSRKDLHAHPAVISSTSMIPPHPMGHAVSFFHFYSSVRSASPPLTHSSTDLPRRLGSSRVRCL